VICFVSGSCARAARQRSDAQRAGRRRRKNLDDINIDDVGNGGEAVAELLGREEALEAEALQVLGKELVAAGQVLRARLPEALDQRRLQAQVSAALAGGEGARSARRGGGRA
jgi:hypothetical protein